MKSGNRKITVDDLQSLFGSSVFSELMDTLPIGVIIATDRSCEALKYNAAAQALLRQTENDRSVSAGLVVKTVRDGRELLPHQMPLQRAVLWNEKVICEEIEFEWADGVKRIVQISAQPLKNADGYVTGAIATVETVAGRKIAEQSFCQMFDLSPAPMLLLSSADAAIVEGNRRLQEFFGVQLSQIIGRTGLELGFWHAREQQRARKQYIKTGALQGFKAKVYSADGLKYVLVDASLLEMGGYTYYLLVFSDITNMEKLQDAFSTIFHYSPGCKAVAELDGTIIMINDCFCRSFGYSGAEIIGQTTERLGLWVFPEQRERFYQAVKKDGFTNQTEALLTTKSGERRVFLVEGAIIEFGNTQYILSSGFDITEKKRREKDTIQTDRLNIIGQTAAGIGHEIRNPLTTVRGYLQFLAHKPYLAPYVEWFELMITELDRANAIITEFLSLAKNRICERQKQNINTLLWSLHPVLEEEAFRQAKKIQIKLEEVPDLLLNAEEIKQVIVNLVTNALEATPVGAGIFITTSGTGEKVVFAVRDSGPEIEPDVLDKLGTPFFTTKALRTGLGLAVCYSIAARHNASIDVRTGSQGSTFSLVFSLS